MKLKTRIVLIEDDFDLRAEIKNLLEEKGWDVDDYVSADQALTSLKSAQWAVGIIDYDLPGESNGVAFIKRIKESKRPFPCILLSSETSDEIYSDLSIAGVSFLPKSESDFLEELPRLVDDFAKQFHSGKIESMNSSNWKVRYTETNVPVLETARSKLILARVQRYIGKSALPVLILGESGTGKESLAKLVHLNSTVPKSNYRPINCAGFTDTLVMSELFGHVRLAFNDAEHRLGILMETAGITPGNHRSKNKDFISYLKSTNNLVLNTEDNVYELVSGSFGPTGTLFLDEIAELPSIAQAALLRCLSKDGLRPVGYSGPAIRLNLRIVAATNDVKVFEEGVFRRDLFSRISDWIIELPALHERAEDALIAAEAAAITWKDEFGIPIPFELTEDAKSHLVELVGNQHFSSRDNVLNSGNFRGLKKAIARACWLAHSEDPNSTKISLDQLRFGSQPTSSANFYSPEEKRDLEHSSGSAMSKKKIALQKAWNKYRSQDHAYEDRKVLEGDAEICCRISDVLRDDEFFSSISVLINKPSKTFGIKNPREMNSMRWNYLAIVGMFKAATYLDDLQWKTTCEMLGETRWNKKELYDLLERVGINAHPDPSSKEGWGSLEKLVSDVTNFESESEIESKQFSWEDSATENTKSEGRKFLRHLNELFRLLEIQRSGLT